MPTQNARAGALSALSALLWLGACIRSAPGPPSPLSDDLVRRHYDQVCMVDRTAKPVLRVGEMFDTAGLGAELTAIGAPPLPAEGRSRSARWRTLDFITRYGRDGRPRRAGVWETTLDSASASRVGETLASRVRPLSGLLSAEGFRVTVTFAPLPVVDIAPPVVCLPHVIHAAGQRPPGLPEEVATWLEPSPYRPRAGTGTGRLSATVRIRLDREGSVLAIDSLAGDSLTVSATREIVRALRFDPALRNGEAIAGELIQSFRFRPGYLPGRL